MSHVLKTRGLVKVSKGQSQPEIVSDIRLLSSLHIYMVLGSPFLYQVLIMTQMLY